MKNNQRKSKRGGARKGAGRKKGVPNKINALVRDMILQALDEAGGVNYLKRQAKKTPVAFLTLLGKVLPTQLTGEGGAPLVPPVVSFVRD